MEIMASYSTIAMTILGALDNKRVPNSDLTSRLIISTRKLLLTILESDDVLSLVAERSYYHSNGFKKIVLFQGGKDKGEIRLHEWEPSDGSQADRHNHPWDFLSLVLQGILENEIFHEEEGSQFSRTVIAPIAGGGDGYAYIPDGSASLSLDFAASPSSAYFTRHNLIHNAFSKAGALTLMVQGPFVRETTFAYCRAECRGREARIAGLAKTDVRMTLERALLCA